MNIKDLKRVSLPSIKFPISSLNLLYQCYNQMASISRNYQAIAIEKKLQRSNKIPKSWLISSATLEGINNCLEVPVTCGILTDVECDITSNHDATALLEKLKSRIWSVEQVTVAFCKRAAIAQQLVSSFISNQ